MLVGLSLVNDETVWPHVMYLMLSVMILFQRAQFLLARDFNKEKLIADGRYTAK